RTGSPVMGCRHWRPASASIWARNSPLGGGAANSCPITEKRRCAHRSWTRGPRACCAMPAPLDQGAPTVDGGLDCWRRASSADREKPLASAPVASGDRGEEAQQRKEPLAAAAVKALDQRDRQAIVIDGRHECGPADLPERARRKGVAPPLSPALDRPAVDADQLGQLSHPRGGRTFPHDRDQHDDRGEIDLAPEKPQRRRRCAGAATVAGAAEAERQSCSSPSPAGRPRGLRRYWAECRTLLHSGHRTRRAAIAMSWSKTRSSSWNVAS